MREPRRCAGPRGAVAGVGRGTVGGRREQFLAEQWTDEFGDEDFGGPRWGWSEGVIVGGRSRVQRAVKAAVVGGGWRRPASGERSRCCVDGAPAVSVAVTAPVGVDGGLASGLSRCMAILSPAEARRRGQDGTLRVGCAGGARRRGGVVFRSVSGSAVGDGGLGPGGGGGGRAGVVVRTGSSSLSVGGRGDRAGPR